MGMTSDQNENESFEEQQARLADEAKRAAELKDKPGYTAIGRYGFEGKDYLLLIGDDKKWYKSEYIRDVREDELNNAPYRALFSDEITPVTEEEFYTWFPRPTV